MRRIVLDAQYSVMTSALTMALKQGGPDFQVQNAGPKTKDIVKLCRSCRADVLLLEVYGPEGLLYATARVPSVERQFAADNVRSMWVREDKKAPFPEADISTPIPELTWEK